VSGQYDLAQYCRAGHEITQFASSSPERRQNFCSTCGAPTISACEGCGAPLRGYYHAAVTGWLTPRANHCYKCGAQHPWVAEKLAAGREMIEFMEDLSPEDKVNLNRSLDDIVQGGARAELGVFRFKTLLAKVTKGGQDLLYKLAVDVASEAAKKMLTGT
jgi:hypothetical protein